MNFHQIVTICKQFQMAILRKLRIFKMCLAQDETYKASESVMWTNLVNTAFT